MCVDIVSNKAFSPPRSQVRPLGNRTFLATELRAGGNKSSDWLGIGSPNAQYDDEGALYYIVIIILVYGMSIIMMIVSLIKKSKQDNAVTRYMKDIDNIRRLERTYREAPPLRVALNVNYKMAPARNSAAAPSHPGSTAALGSTSGPTSDELRVVSTQVLQSDVCKSAETVVNMGAEWDAQKGKIEGSRSLGTLVEEKEEGVRV